ncbi:unnamed protein product [Plutella xylostella]|uniref:(diamondback moth) hypothetical protein n=1 Tax=Plutella xylostella TaxID=51655 RepID=A0A8S4DR49_PLUXY|nr:unnamed protein product [Plutella xylostella]
MGNKRKFKSEDKVLKSSPVEVIAEDVSSHPLCLHGPTLLFSNEKGRFYACSLCRSKKDCTVHISEEDWQNEGVKKRNEKYNNLITKVNKSEAWKRHNEIKSQHPSNRAYCITCEELYIIHQTKKHNKDHRVVTPLTDEQLSHPTTWLPALENDTVEAQYLFSKKSVGTILSVLKKNNLKNILCIGTPSIHEAVSSRQDFTSLLLDYDKRHAQFHPPNKYVYYNMFNNYLFNGREDEKLLKKFMKESSDSGLCIVMDPPFGGRVEPLIQTLKDLTETYKSVNKDFTDQLLPVVWAFPYFSEPYIKNMEPGIKMHDYQVEYENHKKFQNKTSKGRKNGSPVRLFTNLPTSSIDLSHDKNYKLCEKCKVYVSLSNNHCNKCGECTSKNGTTYTHCFACKRCVKPTFFHCKTCERCCQKKDHKCGTVVESQSCFNCRETGHKKADCPQLEPAPGSAKKRRKHA